MNYHTGGPIFNIFFCCFLSLVTFQLQAQVSSEKYSMKDGGKPGALIVKKVIVNEDGVRISGDGKPRAKFVVQLARFESMNQDSLPEQFPKGTFLWISPDHPEETLLLAGFFDSFEEAKAATLDWRKNKMFAKAFARTKPFLILYE